ncbi:B3/B4 domain-containing protein [Devosia soli]|uniref:B3/B4 domain-containing protein n=1 Tax=Devosia soli TaxID=361041 RepID=UPI001FCD39F9|nr:phenylalanine--tRNA ligase beta subunit-related protein [Devosia soli]
MPEIQAWRRVVSVMGLKPTQYRCASEALLRRLRKEGTLPSLHPLIDVCNAVSVGFAIPIAVFDIEKVDGGLSVRPAQGNERYVSFSGTIKAPEAGEIIFADDAGRAHARRWTNRHGQISAVGTHTMDALIVAEALHPHSPSDMEHLGFSLCEAVRAVWPKAMVKDWSTP